MKKQLFCLALLLLLFVGCAKKNEEIPSKPSAPEGIPTSVTFNFATESEFGTRTSTLPDPGTLPEDTAPNVVPGIKSIHILIFDATSENLITNIFENNIQAKKTVTVATTSGQKRIFTLINAPRCFSDEVGKYILGLTTLNQFYTLMSNPLVRNIPLDPVSGSITRTQTEGGGLDGLGSDFISMVNQGGAGVFMSNGASIESLYTLQPNISSDQSSGNLSELSKPEVNRFNIVVMRAAARARLAFASIIQITSAATEGISHNLKVIKTKDNIYEIRANGPTDIKYGIRNLNRSTYAVQHFINDDVKDSDSGTGTGGGFIADPRAPYYYEFSDAANPLDKTNKVFNKYYWDSGFDINTPSNDKTNPFYFIPENNNNEQVIGNTSHFGVMAIIQHVNGKNISIACNRVDEGVENQQLKKRYYDIIPGQDNAESHFNYDSSLLPGNTNNMIFVLRREPDLRINGYSRVAKDPKVAFKLFYYMLEADGIIGTEDNNSELINDGVWGTDRHAPTDIRFLAPLTNNHNPGPKEQGYLYFKDAVELETVFMTMFANPVVNDDRARALVAHFLKIKKYELHKVLGVYIDAKHYYRLNISEKIEHNTINIVRRNYSYSANITGFKTIGEPLPDGLDNPPDISVNDELTFLTADIIVQPWREKVIEEII